MKRAMSSNNIASQDIPTAAESAAKRTRKDSKGNSRSKGTTSRPVRTLSQATADQDKSPAGPSSIDPPEDNEVLSLRSEVAMLKQTVSQLSSRLNFVLSLLGVEEVDSSGAQASVQRINDEEFPSLQQSLPATAVLTQQNTSSVSKPVHEPLLRSYSQVARVKLSDDIRREVLSAVHIEMETKSKRSNCLVVQGLLQANQSTHTDLDHVRDFLSVEFPERSVKVESCKRLGRVSNVGIQPLLVVMESSDQANFIIDNAKRLRHSPILYTRTNIFIGPFLTKAESKAAYELRCKRRTQQAARSARVAAALAMDGVNDDVTGALAQTTSANLSPQSFSQRLNPDAQSFTALPAGPAGLGGNSNAGSDSHPPTATTASGGTSS